MQEKQEMSERSAGMHRVRNDVAPLPVATLQAIVHWWAVRSAAAHLSGYPDRMLKDIGLSRGGIEWAVRHGQPEIAQRRREKE
jgi:uncharacterized protein YjiS (DUF1127 family)